MATFMYVCLAIFAIFAVIFLYEFITYKFVKRRVERNKKLAEQMRREEQGIDSNEDLPDNVIKIQ